MDKIKRYFKTAYGALITGTGVIMTFVGLAVAFFPDGGQIDIHQGPKEEKKKEEPDGTALGTESDS